MKRSFFSSFFVVLLLASAALAQSVSISSPSSGATVSSPVKVVATANGGSYPASAMRVYVDNQSMYTVNAASLNTSVALATGQHHLVVVGWNTKGTSFSSSMYINVGMASSPTTPTGGGGVATSGAHYTQFKATSNWMATLFQPDGALLYGRPLPTTINPYMSNIAAIALTKDGARLAQVRGWMKWVIAHLNYSDKWGMSGTIYDWSIDASGHEASTGDADSTDSYAATFLTLAWNLWKSGDATSQAYLKSISYQLDLIGGVLAQTMQGDGLTWAKPDYLIKYTMDNCEVYRGLKDAASLFNAMGNTTKGSYYATLASQNLNGINGLWMSSKGEWAVYKDWYGHDIGPNMATWYADATAQLFPVLEQVIPASDSRAKTAYAKFNAAWPGWPSLSFQSQDQFPWCLVGAAAALMGDSTRANQYLNKITTKYVNPGFVWTMFNAEGGWYMRTQYFYMGGQF